MRLVLIAMLSFFVGLSVFLLKPHWFVSPDDGMYGNSAARVYGEWLDIRSGGAGDCEELEGTDMLHCPVELDPGSGFGASLAVWKVEGDCWKGYRIVGKRRQDRELASKIEVPPGTHIRGPENQGCIEFYKDIW